MDRTSDESDEVGQGPAQAFDVSELDKLIRQIVDKVRGNYLEHGETARGIPAEVKRIIEQNIDRL
jgi:hypothetical protein